MRCKPTFLFLILVVLLLVQGEGSVHEPRVLVVTTSGVEPYLQAAQSARKLLLERWPATPAVIVLDKNMSLPAALPVEPDDLVIAVGSVALQSPALEGSANVIGCMTMSQQAVRSRRTLANLFLEFPPEIQLEWLRRVLPGVRTLGLVYSAAEAQGRPDSFVAAARKKGVEVGLFPLTSGGGIAGDH